jgi:hypothetical protein
MSTVPNLLDKFNEPSILEYNRKKKRNQSDERAIDLHILAIDPQFPAIDLAGARSLMPDDRSPYIYIYIYNLNSPINQ